MIIYLNPKTKTWKEKFNLIKQLISGRLIKFEAIKQKKSIERWIIIRDINYESKRINKDT